MSRIYLPHRRKAFSNNDPYFNNVVLLVHMNGVDGSTTFIDSSNSAKTITALGDAQIDTSQFKFGGASGLFDGTGDYLTLIDSSDWAFGAGEFTMEAFIKLGNISYRTILNQSVAGASSDSSFIFWLSSDAGAPSGIYVTNGGGSWDKQCTALVTLDTSNFHHIAISRSGDTLMFFYDGIKKAETALGAGYTLNNSTRVLEIGRQNGSFYMNGWIDDLRVTKGVGRYLSDFTPPTQQLPDK